jgi:hypothetical protein
MKWHGFGMYGQGGPLTNPAEAGFSKRVAALGVDVHGSPYRDFEAGQIATIISKIPETEGVFVWGTSLGANNTPMVCRNAERRIDGAFGFQASLYGYHGFLTSNIRFAHLISSHNPLPLPGLGAYVWLAGSIREISYRQEWHDIPHPGDYDVGDQDKFLADMKRIMGVK